jgi:membrane associated rhomboid family serine protease
VPRETGTEDWAASPPGDKRIVNAPPVVLGVIVLLVVLHAVRMMGGDEWDKWALIPARLSMQWWSLLTYAFLHGDWMHLALNCLWLLVFGTPVARWFGPRRFLILAALSAIGGALAMVVTDPESTIPVIGASGAVSGLMAAAIPVMYGRAGRPLLPGELLRDRRALIFVVIWLGITLITGTQAFIGEEGVRIAWEAHLGGFITGFVVYAFMTHRLVRA